MICMFLTILLLALKSIIGYSIPSYKIDNKLSKEQIVLPHQILDAAIFNVQGIFLAFLIGS